MAVYTQLSQQDIAMLLSTYDLGNLKSFEGVSAGIENTNYKVLLKDGRYFFLTIFENLSTIELQYFLPLLHHLKINGCHLPDPIAQSDGEYLFSWQGKPGALFECLNGHHVEVLQAIHCERIGEELARIHLAARSFPKQHANPRGSDWIQARLNDDHLLFKSEERALAEKAMSQLQGFFSRWHQSDLPHGFIHGDLFNDNCLFNDQDEVIGVIDFYAGGDDYWVYDLAITQLAWCRDDEDGFDHAKRIALQKGYEQVRPLQDNERGYLDHFLLLACLRFYLSRIESRQIQQQAGMEVVKDPKEIGTRLQHMLDTLSR
ncbi:homoserine kinase [Bermanella marisrubri]|uniref:Homoserine kinase n=1 Tax=Bermanella marisrubri TaxID=207949 RepID=Q1MZ79_9GAMM|nr:homoserine kinase [Bermanella marisrubri]EAT11254.1 homoserine kinase [Oceanobacter sp. RED65] [Bermanella marisrubri]QIZ82737.1 homoserine kinase [Bermanella marisrubri]